MKDSSYAICNSEFRGKLAEEMEITSNYIDHPNGLSFTDWLETQLSKNERQKLERFRKHTEAHYRKNPTVDGANETYFITPTSIGTIMVAHCTRCQKNFDLTDYDSW